MPRRPLPLPPRLGGAAFTVAHGRSIELGQSRLRGRDQHLPFHGIRIALRPAQDAPSGPGPTPEQELFERCSALTVGLPGGAFFGHLAAGRLWSLQLPRAADDQLLHVCVPRPIRPPRRSGAAEHQVDDPMVTVVYRRGIPVADPATLFCRLAAALTLLDRVAVGDALILEPRFADPWHDRPWATLRQLRERVEIFRGRGKLHGCKALCLIRQDAESRPETLVRLAVLDAGLPQTEVNPDITDARGRLIGRGDLGFRRWRAIAECDGEQHRTDTRQYGRDVRRLEDLASGWRVVRLVERASLLDRDAAMGRVARALREAGWRP